MLANLHISMRGRAELGWGTSKNTINIRHGMRGGVLLKIILKCLNKKIYMAGSFIKGLPQTFDQKFEINSKKNLKIASWQGF